MRRYAGASKGLPHAAFFAALTGLLGEVGTSVAGEPQAAPQELSEVVVIGTSPVPGTGIPMNLYPGNVQTISARTLAPGTQNAGEALDAAVGSVNVNDTQGNRFQTDVNYRGYTASPVLGTPQGLSVYVDGIRVNEPFGDVVSWDLIPQIAISNITVIPGTNPVYGLNTLGGALAVNTKSGFAFPGASIRLATGSFGLRSIDAEYGGHQQNTDYYVASSVSNDHGWANYNPTQVRQVFAKAGYQDARSDVDWSVQYVDDELAGNQLVPFSMIAAATQGYSHPDVTSTHNFATNLTERFQFDAASSFEGNVYYRNIWRRILNSNIGDPVDAGSIDQLATCTALYGQACASNIASEYTQDIYGINIQYSRQEGVFGMRQYFSAGLSSEYGTTQFSQTSQDATVDATFATVGFGGFLPQSDIRSHNVTAGVYATDTLVLDPRWSVTLSARFDHSQIDLSGTSVDSNGIPVGVDGGHSYQRLSPALGATFALTPAVTLYANLAEGFRTPSAIELACADPAHPCAGVPNAFSADPNLQGIRAKSVEAGGRGQIGEHLDWRTAAFRSELDNDILFNQSTLTTGFFSNIGESRREGIEAALDGKFQRLDAVVSATLLQATYQSAFFVADAANAGSVCPGSTCVPVQPGDRIPGIAQFLAKLRLGYQATPMTHVEILLQAQSYTYARGDENNLATQGTIPGFCTVKLAFTHRVNESIDISGSVSNLFNRVSANFGMLSNNDLKGGIPENFWALVQPRALYLSVRAIL